MLELSPQTISVHINGSMWQFTLLSLDKNKLIVTDGTISKYFHFIE